MDRTRRAVAARRMTGHRSGLSIVGMGKGYATEVAARCIESALENLDWNDVIHVINPANEAPI